MMENGALGTHFNAAYLICFIGSRQKAKTLENRADFLQRWDQKCLISIQEKKHLLLNVFLQNTVFYLKEEHLG